MWTPDLDDLQLRPYPETPQDFHHLNQAAKYVRESAEQWYMETRKAHGNPRLRLEPVVLKPLSCDDCAVRMGAATRLERLLYHDTGESEPVPVLPINPTPNRVRFYDRSAGLLHLEPHQRRPQDWFGVTCPICGQRIDTKDGDDMIRVGEESFEDYFGLPNPTSKGYIPSKRPRGPTKKRLAERVVAAYGLSCFECEKELTIGETLTLDHIVPKSKKGAWETINFQPLCRACQSKKADLMPETVLVALDMLVRPLPSDSYDGPIW